MVIKADNVGETPLLRASKTNNNLNGVKSLLKHPSIDPNKANRKNEGTRTPIVRACELGQQHVAEELVKHPRINLCIESRIGRPACVCRDKGHWWISDILWVSQKPCRGC